MAEDTQQLTNDIEVTRGDLTRNLDALTDRVSPGRVGERRVEATRTSAARVRDRVMGQASHLSDSVADGGSAAKSSAADTATGAVGSAKQRTEGNPLVAGAIAFGIGWLASSLLPASQREAQAAHGLVDVAKEHGQPVADKVKSAGQDVASSMQDKVKDAATSVTETAKESAAHVSDDAKGSVETISADAKGSAQGVAADAKDAQQG